MGIYIYLYIWLTVGELWFLDILVTLEMRGMMVAHLTVPRVVNQSGRSFQ